VTLIVIPLLIVLIAVIILSGIYLQHRRYSDRYKAIGRMLCDDDSWQVSFYVRTLLLKGTVGGHRIRYTVVGEDRRDQPVGSYLLLEYPVKRNFRFYAASDPDQVDPDIRSGLEKLQQITGFCGLTVISRKTPFLGKFLGRPLGFGYRPGLVLWKFGRDAFNPESIRRDVLQLLRLAEQGI
jgi:hypothetical protein